MNLNDDEVWSTHFKSTWSWMMMKFEVLTSKALFEYLIEFENFL